MKKIFDELHSLWDSINAEDLNVVASILAETDARVFCLGAGRMGYAVQAFAMRLSHLGLTAFMIGDTTLPRVKPGDIVIINSSSGETPTIRLLAGLAKDNGGRLICFTSNPDSSLGHMSELVIGYKNVQTRQLMKTVYEQFSFILFDYLADEIFSRRSESQEWVEQNHSILE